MNGFDIRKTSHGDLDAMEAIERECFSDPWSRESLRGAVDADAALCFTAQSGETVVGYGMIYVVSDESEILNIAVSPSERRCGAGSALMKKMLTEASERGAAVVYLEVRESNEAAISLYEKFGFSVLGRRKNYYKYPTEDALLMARVLSADGVDNDNPRN